jgi:membrane protein required for colicin V production
VNGFDLTLLSLLALFSLIGAWRGLVRELVSLLTWVGAAAAAWFFAGDIADLFGAVTREQALQQVLAFAVIFIAVFIVGTMIGVGLHGLVSRSSGMRSANRTMGGMLGLVRGAAIIVILFLVAGVTPYPKRDWWREAALTPTFENMAAYVARYLPQDVARHVRYG